MLYPPKYGTITFGFKISEWSEIILRFEERFYEIEKRYMADLSEINGRKDKLILSFEKKEQVSNSFFEDYICNSYVDSSLRNIQKFRYYQNNHYLF